MELARRVGNQVSNAASVLFRLVLRCLLIVVLTVTLAASEPPYVGRWKLNYSKSDVSHITLTITVTPAGMLEASGGIIANGAFRIDGQDYDSGAAYRRSWRQIDARTWEITNKARGNALDVQRLSLSANRKTLTVLTLPVAGGRAVYEHFVLRRVSGSDGLVGTWRVTAANQGDQVIEFAPDDDGLTIHLANGIVECLARFDGRDYPMVGGNVPAGLTIALRPIDARSFEAIHKYDGKIVQTNPYSVSSDGRRLTAVVQSGQERLRLVYDRQ